MPETLDDAAGRGGSPSLHQPDYWWYDVRGRLLRVVFDPVVHGATGARVLDVGSADGPSKFWQDREVRLTQVDPDPRGLSAATGVCARLPELPFGSEVFDIVSAFDVVEHCVSERDALDEIWRVLKPGGRVLISVPAYQWAWTEFDEANGHYRRYTRDRAVRALTESDFEVDRATHAFAGVFPAFAVQRLASRLRNRARRRERTSPADVVAVPHVSPTLQTLFRRLSRLDERVLQRHNVSFGSSIFVTGVKPVSSDEGVTTPAES